MSFRDSQQQERRSSAPPIAWNSSSTVAKVDLDNTRLPVHEVNCPYVFHSVFRFSGLVIHANLSLFQDDHRVRIQSHSSNDVRNKKSFSCSIPPPPLFVTTMRSVGLFQFENWFAVRCLPLGNFELVLGFM